MNFQDFRSKVKFSNEKPPVYDRCVKEFGVGWEGVYWAYGDTIHSKEIPPEHVIRHECVHFGQQEKVGGAEAWWEIYFNDPKFRLEQEIEAYKEEYKYLKSINQDRNWLNSYVVFWAKNLSGKGYGYLIKYEEAIKRIKDN